MSKFPNPQQVKVLLRLNTAMPGAWIGGLDCSRRVLYSLEGQGLIQLTEATTSFKPLARLTPTGRTLALKLATPNPAIGFISWVLDGSENMGYRQITLDGVPLTNCRIYHLTIHIQARYEVRLEGLSPARFRTQREAETYARMTLRDRDFIKSSDGKSVSLVPLEVRVNP
jgi:hypothetical protein